MANDTDLSPVSFVEPGFIYLVRTQNFRKTNNISHPLIHTYVGVHMYDMIRV